MLYLIDFLFILLCIVVYQYEKQFSIAFINCVIWTLLSCLNTMLGFPVSIRSFGFVFLCTFMFSLLYMFANKKIRVGKQENVEDETIQFSYDASKYKKTILLIALLNLISVFFMARNLGFTFSTFTNVSRLMAKMNAISSLRYTGAGENLPLISRVINAVVYASLGYSGYFFSYDKKRIHFLNLALILAETIILNTKATLVYALAFWMGGFFTGYKMQRKKPKVRSILILVFSVVAVIFFAAEINYLRHHGVKPYLTELQTILFSYLLGPYSAFSLWFDTNRGGWAFGANTFACIFRVFGIASQEHGDSIALNAQFSTNVYTIFKHLLSDYSYIGTVLAVSFVGFISGISNGNLKKGRLGAIAFSIVISSTILIAFFSSMFRYTTNVLACILIFMVPLLKHVTIGGKRII